MGKVKQEITHALDRELDNLVERVDYITDQEMADLIRGSVTVLVSNYQVEPQAAMFALFLRAIQENRDLREEIAKNGL